MNVSGGQKARNFERGWKGMGDRSRIQRWRFPRLVSDVNYICADTSAPESAAHLRQKYGYALPRL
jgi:hypothetical protein